MQTPNHLQDHIETIAKHEQDFQASRSKGERIGDRVAAFAGGFPFVAIHITFFLAWMAINTLSVGTLRHFDPAPFPPFGYLCCLGSDPTGKFHSDAPVRTGKTS